MKKEGFTMIEMMFCLGIILVLLLLIIPDVTSKNTMVKNKGCEALLEVVNAQILLYEINEGELPTSIEDLTSGQHPYLSKKQSACPNGKQIYISDGQAYVS